MTSAGNMRVLLNSHLLRAKLRAIVRSCLEPLAGLSLDLPATSQPIPHHPNARIPAQNALISGITGQVGS